MHDMSYKGNYLIGNEITNYVICGEIHLRATSGEAFTQSCSISSMLRYAWGNLERVCLVTRLAKDDPGER